MWVLLRMRNSPPTAGALLLQATTIQRDYGIPRMAACSTLCKATRIEYATYRFPMMDSASSRQARIIQHESGTLRTVARYLFSEGTQMRFSVHSFRPTAGVS